jgi:hypothetical protein
MFLIFKRNMWNGAMWKENGKLLHYYFPWIVCSEKQRRIRCASSGDKTANWKGGVLCKNCLRRHVIEGQKDKEEDVSSYWITREGT